MSDDGTFVAVYPDGRRVRLRWPMRKQLDDQEYSLATGAQYPRTRRSFLEVLEDLVDDDEGDDDDDDEIGKQAKAAKTEKESNVDTLTSIMKSGGIGATCACIVAKGATSFSEFQIVEAASAAAHDRHPDMSPSQAFSKIYSAATDEARVLRDAIAVAKAPTVISGGDLRDANDVAQAMDQLREIGRRMAPTATAEKQFAVAFSDPKNVALALRVHQRPSATTSFPFPIPR